MVTNIIHHPNGFDEITGCPSCDGAPYLLNNYADYLPQNSPAKNPS